jgi:hypothetical protein
MKHTNIAANHFSFKRSSNSACPCIATQGHLLVAPPAHICRLRRKGLAVDQTDTVLQIIGNSTAVLETAARLVR